MTYTKAIKLCILSELLLIVGLPLIIALEDKEVLPSGISLPITIGLAIAFLATGFYKDYGKYKKWRNVWKDPIWQKVLLIVVAVVVFITIVTDLDYEKTRLAVLISVTITQILRDVRYYNRATKYDMDNLSDVNELARRFPETREIIGRKKKKPEDV